MEAREPIAYSPALLALDPPLLRDLEHVTVVTPSPHRASAVRLAYDLAQARRCSSWRTPDTLALSAWLEREAYRAADAGAAIPRPLRAVEEWWLWREAVVTDWGDSPGAARLAQSLARAAHTLFEWQIDPAVLARSGTDEGEWLARALARVELACREAHAMPRHALFGRLRGRAPKRPVRFAGFLEVSAARRAWLQSACEGGADAREYRNVAAPGRMRAARASAPAEELEWAAQWCRAHLERDPSRRLLVVIPGLIEQRTAVTRVFAQTLAARAALAGERAPGVLTTDTGEPLGRTPLARHALTSLQLLTGRLAHAVVSAWLRAPRWRIAPAALARLDAGLRRSLGYDVAARDLLASLEALQATLGEAASALRLALTEALEALGDVDQPAPLGRWAERFERALAALEQAGPSAEPRRVGPAPAAVRFAQVLADLAAVGGRMSAVSARQALQLLEALVARAVCPPERGEAAVTLSGELVDPIVHYDGIWVTGLHADAWPPPPAVDPFIPLPVQVEVGLPGATARDAVLRARALLECWRRSTPDLVASWPERSADCGCMPSPLLTERRDVEAFKEGRPHATLAAQIRAARCTEAFEDASGAAWPADTALPAGTQAIDLQSRCAFRAYAQLRLGAVALETPRLGIDPRVRGRLLHRALERLWQVLGAWQGLDAYAASGALGSLIERCVARAALEVPVAAPPRDLPDLERLEIRRAERVVRALAMLERARPSFTVHALEQAAAVELAGARVNVRIDRIDVLDDGTWAILDYKTGQPTALDWLCARPRDPQLLVYLLATGGHASTLAQVHLSARHSAFRGLADRRDRLARVAGLAADSEHGAVLWREQVERWRRDIEALAREFLRGAAAVDPLPGACRLCHLHTFCRVSAQPPLGASSDGSAL